MTDLNVEQLNILRAMAKAEEKGANLDDAARTAAPSEWDRDRFNLELQRLHDAELAEVAPQYGDGRLLGARPLRVLPAGLDALREADRPQTVEQRDQDRRATLGALYDLTDAAPQIGDADLESTSEVAGIPLERVRSAFQWLIERGLAEGASLSTWGITPAGVDQVEEWRREAERDQSLGTGAVLLTLTIAELRKVEEATTEVQRVLSTVGEAIDPDVVDEIESDVRTLSDYARKPKAKRSVVAAMAQVVRVHFLTAAMHGVVGNRADDVVRRLVDLASHLAG